MRFLAVIAVVALVWAGAFYFINQKSESETPQPAFSYVNADEDSITVAKPAPGDAVGRTFTVSGEARGTWYFEASFPAEVVDPSGAILFQGPITAGADWMTTEFVPFSAEITVSGAYAGPATLVLKKDNPSGDPERDASVSVPVVLQ